MMRKTAGIAAIFALLTLTSDALAAFINTNDAGTIALFQAGATVIDFESIAGLTPLDLTSYDNAANSSTTVPTAAQLSTQIAGLLFHSGGGNFNNPVGNPGTPTALLRLQGGIAGDAQSPTNVLGSLEINSDLLDIDQFIEVGATDGTRYNRIGFWLNPALGSVLLTAFDENLTALDSGTGTAGNFIGVSLATDQIRSISIISLSSGQGFTIDDLTLGQASVTVIPEPSTFVLATLGGLGLVGVVRRRRRA